jgi:dihydroflavonol-4-reductase
MIACVTGGTGFVGSHIARQLAEAGHTVRILHRTSSRLDALKDVPFESAIGDVTDLESMRAAFAGCDWVFHAAAVADYWRADQAYMFDVNVEGTRKVLQAAREQGVQRVIFTSSAAAVGLTQDGSPADESYTFNLPPQHFPYGYSKVQAEAVVREAVSDGQDIVILNPVVIMGPGDLNMISGSFIVQLQQWQWLAPATYGGVAVVDVRDVAAAHLAAAERGRTGERYLLCTANYTYREWFQIISSTLDAAEPVFYTPSFILPTLAGVVDGLRRVGVPMPIDANQVRLGGRMVYFDGGKAQRELHTPRIEMRRSVQDTYQWYLENGYLKQNAAAKMLGGISRLWRR